MRIKMYPDSDAAVITIREGKPHHTNVINNAVSVDVDDDDTPMSITILYLSDGVDKFNVPGLAELQNQQVLWLLREATVQIND